MYSGYVTCFQRTNSNLVMTIRRLAQWNVSTGCQIGTWTVLVSLTLHDWKQQALTDMRDPVLISRGILLSLIKCSQHEIEL